MFGNFLKSVGLVINIVLALFIVAACVHMLGIDLFAITK